MKIDVKFGRMCRTSTRRVRAPEALAATKYCDDACNSTEVHVNRV